MRVGGQQSFSLETSSCLCIPKAERGGMEIVAATEDLTGLQRFVSQALKASPSCIRTRVKRIGRSPSITSQ